MSHFSSRYFGKTLRCEGFLALLDKKKESDQVVTFLFSLLINKNDLFMF